MEHKKYDLAQFLRDRIMTSSSLQPILDEVEPPFAGYRRTEQALARYMELARTDNGEKLPAVTKPVDLGQAYSGVPRLARLLRLVGDLPTTADLPGDAQIYDGQLVEAVKNFQRRHGMDTDGRPRSLHYQTTECATAGSGASTPADVGALALVAG